MYGKNPRLQAKNSTSHKINEGWKIGFWRTFNWSWLITLCYCQTWKLQIHTYILINTLSDTKGSWLKLCKWLLLFFERKMNRRWDGGRNKKTLVFIAIFLNSSFKTPSNDNNKKKTSIIFIVVVVIIKYLSFSTHFQLVFQPKKGFSETLFMFNNFQFNLDLKCTANEQ